MSAAEVTTFSNAMSPDCQAVDTVASVLEAIKTGEFQAEIDNLRRILRRDGGRGHRNNDSSTVIFAGEKSPASAEAPVPTRTEVLLEEIRDALEK